MPYLKLHGKKGKGKVALISECDVEDCKHFLWAIDNGYAYTTIYGRKVYLQDFIMRPPKGFMVDHINHDTLNCTRENLRVCTKVQNGYNSNRKDRKYKGVTALPNGKFKARITIDGKTINLGVFVFDMDAAIAYDKAAIEYFGEFAYLNFGGTK